MIPSTRAHDARRTFSFAFLCLACLLCGKAWADDPDVILSRVPATRALAVSGDQSPSLFVPPSIQADEGSSLSLQVTATDPDSTDKLSLTLSSPLALGLQLNASVSSSLIIANLKGLLGFNDAGTYALVWTLSDGVNPPVTANTTLTVRNVPPPPQAPTISVFPNELLLDKRTNVLVKGEKFGTSTWVELRGAKGTVFADTVTIISPTALAASVLVPAAMEGKFDLVVTGPSGSEQKRPLGIEASIYRVGGFDATTGKPLLSIPRAQSGVLKAPSNSTQFPCEGTIFCSGTGYVSILPGCEKKLIYPYGGLSGFNYYIYYGGVKRRCFAKLHLRTKTVDGLGVTPDPTGGHCHSDSNRPIGSPVDASGYTSDGTSSEFGVFHQWPAAAGQLEAVLWTTDPNCPNDADSVTANFLYCIASPAAFDPWGIRSSGPGDFQIGIPPNGEHLTNSAMLAAMAVALDSVSAEWQSEHPNGPKLGFNDASLPWGGVFDVLPLGGYTPEHCGHRVGTEMDVASAKQNPSVFNNPDLVSDAQVIFEKWKFWWAPEGNHFHVYYHGPGAYMGPGSPIPYKISQRKRPK